MKTNYTQILRISLKEKRGKLPNGN